MPPTPVLQKIRPRGASEVPLRYTNTKMRRLRPSNNRGPATRAIALAAIVTRLLTYAVALSLSPAKREFKKCGGKLG